MRHEPTADHLDLWRGIDDAVWREALREVRPRAVPVPLPMADIRRKQPAMRASPQPALVRVSEPA